MGRKLLIILFKVGVLCLILSAITFTVIAFDYNLAFILFSVINAIGIVCYCLAFREFENVDIQCMIQSYVKTCLTSSIVVFAILYIFYKNVAFLFLAILDIGGVISYQYVLDDYDK